MQLVSVHDKVLVCSCSCNFVTQTNQRNITYGVFGDDISASSLVLTSCVADGNCKICLLAQMGRKMWEQSDSLGTL